MERNELPTTYADQVVEFIEKNTAGVELGTGGGEAYVDPYTGSSRYTGGGVPTGNRSGALAGDPLTGGSRYTGGGVPTGGASYGGGSDPFTGGSSYSTTPAAPVNKILPVKTFLSFKKINAAAAKTKVEEFERELVTHSVSVVGYELMGSLWMRRRGRAWKKRSALLLLTSHQHLRSTTRKLS